MTSGEGERDRLGGGPSARTFTVSSTDIDRCPIRSLVPAHYNDDGSCRCARNTTGKVLVMCGTCTGTGKVTVPGQRHQVRACPTCHGEGIR